MTLFLALPASAVTAQHLAPRSEFGLSGKVSKISKTTITVKASLAGLEIAKGKSYVVETNAKTVYINPKGDLEKFSNLKVGAEVAIVGSTVKNVYTAYSVNIET